MPLYDYQCEKCEHIVEVMHGVNDTGPARCERCGGPMRKLMSSPSIHFKGSGWAKKDALAGRSSGTPKSATDTDAGRGSASSETKSDKPAAGSSDSDASKPSSDVSNSD